MKRVMGRDGRLMSRALACVGCRRGVAMFEFALVLPILMVIIFGGWEVARGLWTYEMLNKSVRDAARYVARLDDPTAAEVQAIAEHLVLTGDIDLDQPPRLDYTKTTVTVGMRVYDNSAGTYRGPDGGTADINVVQVRADYQYDAPLLSWFGMASPLTISVAHEQRHIRD